jgi:hypothetical protein
MVGKGRNVPVGMHRIGARGRRVGVVVGYRWGFCLHGPKKKMWIIGKRGKSHTP